MNEWTWEEIRGWIDGEGYIYGRVTRRTIRGKPYIDKHIAVDIYQKDPTPLHSMCEWMKKQRVPCSVVYRPVYGRPMYRLETTHRKERPLPALQGLKVPAKQKQLQRAMEKTGISV